MEYKISGIIKFSEVSKLKLDNNKLIFNSPNFTKVTISSTDSNDFNIKLTLSANNESEAKVKAELELARISNLISYFHDVPVIENRITGIISQFQNAPNQKNIKISEFIHLSESISVVKGLGSESIEKLKNKLEKIYSNDFEEMVFLWRQAISEDNSVSRYLLLYRLLELLFEQDTKLLTNWIKTIEPQVKMCQDRKRGEHTIYTYLRDCIHPKTEKRTFPLKEISDMVNPLQNLVYRKIQEKYGESIY